MVLYSILYQKFDFKNSYSIYTIAILSKLLKIVMIEYI